MNYEVQLKEDRHMTPIKIQIAVPNLKDVAPFAHQQMKVWGWKNGEIVGIERKEEAVAK
jgi:hypothetical protein